MNQTRERMVGALSGLGFQVTPSNANFLWCTRTDRPVEPIYAALKSNGILVRYMNYPPWGDGLRISVGTDSEIDAMLVILESILRV
jgi:histidinol-phosphate aminotransferase